MYILTTSKRIHQITIVFLVLLVFSGVVFWWAWRSAHVVGPARFIEKIRESQRLTLKEIDVESIRAILISSIDERLTSQLSASNISQPDQTTQIMLPQVTDFLNKDKAVLNVVNQQLKQLPIAESGWQKITSNSDEQVYSSLGKCLTIVRMDSDWILQKIDDCNRDIDTSN